jgi:cyclic pyranopterin phosphate synthase
MPNQFRYLRVSLLAACNFNCFYCRPLSMRKAIDKKLTRPNKFKEAIELLCRLGIRKVRFTGGEPTLYKRLPDLVAHTKEIDESVHTAITSNGSLLKRMAPSLGDAGLDSINISLDTIDRSNFKAITSTDGLQKVLAGIESAMKHIPTVKLNCVVMGGVNSDEVGNMVRFADKLGIDIRFIEYMPTLHGSSQGSAYVSGETIRADLGYSFYPVESNPGSAACYYRSDDLGIRVGYINPVSHPFCTDCDRIRLTAEGNLYGCLFSGQAINLFEMIDDQPDNIANEIKALIAARTNTGCSLLSRGDHYLPSFIVTGG